MGGNWRRRDAIREILEALPWAQRMKLEAAGLRFVSPDQLAAVERLFHKALVDMGATPTWRPEMSKTHEVKTLKSFFDAVLDWKLFEVRFNDRDYRVGDRLVQKEFDPEANPRTLEERGMAALDGDHRPNNGGFTGRSVARFIKGMLALSDVPGLGKDLGTVHNAIARQFVVLQLEDLAYKYPQIRRMAQVMAKDLDKHSDRGDVPETKLTGGQALDQILIHFDELASAMGDRAKGEGYAPGTIRLKAAQLMNYALLAVQISGEMDLESMARGDE